MFPFAIDIKPHMWYYIIVPKRYRTEVNRVQGKKKTADILNDIDSGLDKVLSILTKLALVSMSIRTILEIWSNT